MTVAICSGSFDPITVGHTDIILRSAKLFDEIIVLVLINPLKTPTFSIEERISYIRKSTVHIPNIRVDSYEGLLVDYAKKVKANAVIRGLRAITDFEYEFQMALINKKLYPEMETIYLNTASENMYLSSSIVKQIAMFNGDISPFIPEEILKDVEKKLVLDQKGRNYK